MRKILTYVLVLSTVINTSRLRASSLVDEQVKQAAALRLQINHLQPGTHLTVKLKDKSELDGELASVSEEVIQLNGSQPVAINFADIGSVSEDPGAQTAPAGGQGSSAHHHRVRTIVILLAVCFTFALVAAVASK